MSSKQPAALPPFELADETQANWSEAQELFYIDLMADKAIAKSNKGTCTFSKGEWVDMRKQHYYRWGCKYNPKAFKNKMTSLKERFKEFKKLVQASSGLRWDPAMRSVIASHSWWDDYVKTNPKAKRLRNEGCPEYEKLALIFGETVAFGHLQATSNQDTTNSNSTGGKEDGLNEHTLDNIQSTRPPCQTALIGRMCSEDAAAAAARRYDDEQDQQQHLSASNSTRSRLESSRGGDSEGSEVSEALKKIAEASQAMTNKYTISECMKILDAMGAEVGDRTYMRALKLLQEKGWREAFICMPLERRKGWLRSIEDGDI